MESSKTTDVEYDVAIVGYGPVGRMLALKLGRRGHSVVVLERQVAQYPLPRAVHFDDEAGRIFQSIGLSPDRLPDAVGAYDDFYEWRAADGQTLTRLDWRGRGPSGWNVSNFFHQTVLETAISEQVGELANVTVLYDWRVLGATEDETGVTLRASDGDGRPLSVRARYVVGADGANSIVREWIGGEVVDLGYFHDWLVVDLRMTAPIDFEPPAWQLCDPARPTTLVPGGPGRRRFEFMRLDGEMADQLKTAEASWRLLEPWGVTPANATLERNVVYTFQARWASEWRRGRMLIAGDSAHLMPPFAGQGMCSGLRDAMNLEWKLDLVLRDEAADGILDSYGPERIEHVRSFIDASMELGAVICITDPVVAAERDVKMIADLASGFVPLPRPLPRLGPGIHTGVGAGGTLSIQASVRSSRGEGLFDDVSTGGGTLLLRSPAQLASVGPEARAVLARLGFQIIALDTAPGDDAVVDVDGGYDRWFAEIEAVAVLIRPDFYVYGAEADAESIGDLVASFASSATVRASAR